MVRANFRHPAPREDWAQLGRAEKPIGATVGGPDAIIADGKIAGSCRSQASPTNKDRKQSVPLLGAHVDSVRVKFVLRFYGNVQSNKLRKLVSLLCRREFRSVVVIDSLTLSNDVEKYLFICSIKNKRQ